MTGREADTDTDTDKDTDTELHAPDFSRKHSISTPPSLLLSPTTSQSLSLALAISLKSPNTGKASAHSLHLLLLALGCISAVSAPVNLASVLAMGSRHVTTRALNSAGRGGARMEGDGAGGGVVPGEGIELPEAIRSYSYKANGRFSTSGVLPPQAPP